MESVVRSLHTKISAVTVMETSRLKCEDIILCGINTNFLSFKLADENEHVLVNV